MTETLFRGTGTALVTPFTLEGDIDVSALRRLIDFQIAGGVDALVVLGTTGENPTIADYERRLIVDTAVDRACGRVPVVIGTGGNDTRTTVANARYAESAGADGQLVVGPYYNKPTQEGFVAHVEAIADATSLPIIIYNVPGRTGFNILPETVLRLAREVESVVAVKEASGNLSQIADILAGRPDDFAVYSGDDELTLPIGLMGGDGVISVISNALPEVFSNFVRDVVVHQRIDARVRHFDLLRAMRACFTESNPIPIKAVLAELGLIHNVLRLPLLPLSDHARARVLEAFDPFLRVAVAV